MMCPALPPLNYVLVNLWDISSRTETYVWFEVLHSLKLSEGAGSLAHHLDSYPPLQRKKGAC